jgi:multiple sugar transport system substrate-binding protein
MRKRVFGVLSFLFIGLAVAQTEVRWFVGLGAGTDEPTLAPQREIVEEFNASQDEIELILEIVDAAQAQDVLATQIAAGNPPDLVGPMGVQGRAAFAGSWRDLTPLIEANNYDLTDFNPALVEFYKLGDTGQLGIPFAVYPSFTLYNQDLFDEAGLPYPPTAYGEPYVNADGEEQPWDITTLRELALLLTVDANGNDATMEEFDKDNIVQWGFGQQFQELRGIATLFGSGNFVDEEGNAVIPEHWRTAFNWYQDAMWEDGFYPTGPYGASTVLSEGNWFDSGNIAMVNTHLWYLTCCLTSLDAAWAVAPVPAYEGETTAKLHAGTFGILEGGQHPEEAFEVLSYLLSPETAGRLANIYGGMPARLSLQEGYFESFSEKVGQDINWDVVVAGLDYVDNPSHEEGMPGYREARDLYLAFEQRLINEPDLDVDAELETLREGLQTIFDATSERN